jgi:TRAP-type C4-dicarboxylate transport system substrate-binding protein
MTVRLTKLALGPIGALFIAGAVTLGGPAAHGQTVELAMAHEYPTNHLQGKAYEAFVGMVDKASGGRIKVVSHPGGSLIKFSEALAAVGSGAVDVGPMIGGFQTGKMAINNLTSLPALFQDKEHFRRALDEGGLFELLSEEYAKNNVKLLNYFTKGATFVFHKDKFLIAPADYKGANLRGLGGYLTLMLEELGVTVVTLPTGEVTTALQRGVVDGLTTSCIAHLARGWAEDAPYVSDVDLAESGEGMGMNLDRFNKLAPDLQAAIMTAAKEMQTMVWNDTLAADRETCAQDWAKLKLPNQKASVAEREALRDAAKALYDKAKAEIPRYDEYIAIVEKTRS